MFHKMLRRFVKQRAARHFGAACDLNEASIEQFLHNAVNGDAADSLNVGFSYRLSVGDDRERLESRRAKSSRTHLRKKLAYPDLILRSAD